MEFFEVIENRASIREFKPREIEDEKLEKILEAASLAPSAGNLQAYEIFVVENTTVKRQIARAADGQNFIAKAPIVLIFVANPERSAKKYQERGRILYCTQDATIACVFAWLAAVSLELAAVWIGAFEPETVKKILKIPVELEPVAILPIGYGAEKAKSKKRRPLGDIISYV